MSQLSQPPTVVYAGENTGEASERQVQPGDSRAELIFTGDELLRGEVVNTNQAYLGERLLSLGLFPTHALCVADDVSTIAAAIKDSLGRGPALLALSGGLGPTEDDLTREAVARALGRPLEFHPELLDQIRDRFASRGLVMSETNRRQAFLPQGATALPFRGTAPGFSLTEGDTLMVALPGVPWELKETWEQEVEPLLLSRSSPSTRTKVRQVRTFGMGESVIAELLSELDWRGPRATIGTRAALDGVTVILRTEGGSEVEAELDALQQQVVQLLGERVFSLGSESLPEVVGSSLRNQGRKVAVAESCTGGLLSKHLTDVPGSSDYFVGGVVSYDNQVKSELLGVSPELLAAEGAVSEGVAAAMVRGVARLMAVDCALSTTGIAGPGGGSKEKPVGLVFLGSLVDDVVEVERLHLFGDRDQIREHAAFAALDLLRRRVQRQAGSV